MKPKAIGFYWTLSVNWKPIEKPDWKNVEQAAQKSRTIAWQREAVHRWAKENGHELIDERIYLEIYPDRVSPEFDSEIEGLKARARDLKAKVLFVDFHREIGWRKQILLNHLGAHGDPFLAISISDQEAKRFEAHFASWRNDYGDWLRSRPGRIAQAANRARELRDVGKTLEEIAAQLNDEEIWSVTGKPWTGESLRKFLKTHA